MILTSCACDPLTELLTGAKKIVPLSLIIVTVHDLGIDQRSLKMLEHL